MGKIAITGTLQCQRYKPPTHASLQSLNVYFQINVSGVRSGVASGS